MSLEKRTYKDRASANKLSVSKRRRKIKEMAVHIKGGKCQLCGYNKYIGALDFHHVEENKKSFSLAASGLTRSWDRTRAELDKCVLVCSNCHREIHAGIMSLDPKKFLV